MDDLARRRATHTRVCMVRVLAKVVKNLSKPVDLEIYLRCIGRLHQLAGVDKSYLTLSGQAFCTALDSIEQHKDLWSKQVTHLVIVVVLVLIVVIVFIVVKFDVVDAVVVVVIVFVMVIVIVVVVDIVVVVFIVVFYVAVVIFLVVNFGVVVIGVLSFRQL